MGKILVIGDSCKDVYVYGSCERLCPDAPVPVLIPKETKHTGGMAMNVYNNLKALNIDCEILTNKVEITKTRYVDDKTNQMLVRIDTGEELVDRIDLSEVDLSSYSAIIISDYVKGFLHEDDIETICKSNDLVVIDTKRLLGNYCSNAKFIKVNELEYKQSKHLLGSLNLDSKLLVTLGSGGCTHDGVNYPVDKVEVKDQTGAGDTFIAGFISNYSELNDVAKAITFANECATKVVQKRGVETI